jgi:hypothetical protein
MSSGFWNIPEEITTRSPNVILREQADALTQSTNSQLMGYVDISSVQENFYAELVIMAPALNNYLYRLLRVRYKVGLYPAHVTFNPTLHEFDATDESQFVELLRALLQNPETGKVISGLLAQMR